MADRTKVLDYIIDTATDLSREAGHTGSLAHYFAISLFKVAALARVGALWEKVRELGAATEVATALEALDLSEANPEQLVDGLTEYVKSAGYNATVDDMLFGVITTSAEYMAREDGRTRMTVVDFAKAILAESSGELLGRIRRVASGESIVESAPEAENTESAPEEGGETKKTRFGFSGIGRSRRVRTELGGRFGAQVAEEDLGNISERELEELIASAKKIQQGLLSSIFGQDQAINAFTAGYFQAELMKRTRNITGKPKATFLFAGPPGVGKTFLAERAAELLGMPFAKFDMSEYSDKEANIAFAGSNEVYKSAKEGNVTSFVDKNPKCVVLFDEIEKAHVNVIHLFLQILDAGRVRDNFTEKEVSFADAIIIFTTNAGRNLYDDPTIVNLSGISRKKVIRALTTDINPYTGTPMFPPAICSRFASGRVLMFNRLDADSLLAIAERTLLANVRPFVEKTGIEVNIGNNVAPAILYAEGAAADARTVKGRSDAFFYSELYELFRLMQNGSGKLGGLKKISVRVDIPEDDKEIAGLFLEPKKPDVLVFTSPEMAAEFGECESVSLHITDDVNEAKELLFKHDISVVLCDVKCKSIVSESDERLLSLEDVSSVGKSFMESVLAGYDVPLYLLELDDQDISKEEFLSFAALGARGIVTVRSDGDSLDKQIYAKCVTAQRQNNLNHLFKTNKVLSYKTAQKVNSTGTGASIVISDFKLTLAADVEDSASLLDSVSRPSVLFEDVIGAEDAKDELRYFVKYLTCPTQFIRRGMRAPKGVLLYGPPGTGKTLLAKAMAGESDLTFIAAEGNQFLKRYVGDGPESVHRIFNLARKYAPSILFIDEIDAIAKERTGGSASEDVLTAFLTEMDGFSTDTTKPVFVLATTNYDLDGNSAKRLDPALVRRFDRSIYVDLPNKEERKRYIRLKMRKNVSLVLSEEQVDNIAVRSTGMSLASLESIIELAMRNAFKRDVDIVDDRAFEEAFESHEYGEEKKWDGDSLERTARHEAGHALLCWLSGENPTYLTVVARGDHGGYMQRGDNEQKGNYTKGELISQIRTSLAGRAAEMVYYGEDGGLTTGAVGDLQNATRVARYMICNCGMDEEFGLVYIPAEHSKENPAVTKRIGEILLRELEITVKTVAENRAAIDALTVALLEKNHLRTDEIDAILSANAKR